MHPSTRPAAERRRAIAANLGAVVCWAAAPVMVKAVTPSFPVHVQNLFRYLVSLAVLWPVFLATADRSRLAAELAAARRAWWRIGVIALVQYGFQVAWTYSLYLLYPGLVSLLGQSQVLFGLLLGLLLFPDERVIVRDRLFLTGIAFSVMGVVLVALGRHGWGTTEFNIGVLVVLASGLAWALLGSLIRAWIPHLPPLLSISSVFTVLVPLFLLTTLLATGPLPLAAAPMRDWVILLGSGLVGIGLGQSLFYRAVPVIGVATSTSLGLLIPLFAGVASWLLFGEVLEGLQIIGGAFLLLGSWLIIRLRVAASR